VNIVIIIAYCVLILVKLFFQPLLRKSDTVRSILNSGSIVLIQIVFLLQKNGEVSETETFLYAPIFIIVVLICVCILNLYFMIKKVKSFLR